MDTSILKQLATPTSVALALALTGTGTVSAQSFSEDFSGFSISDTPTATAVQGVTVIDGSGTIGDGNAAQVLDTSASSGDASYLEYNFATNEASEFGAVVYSFDIYNNKVSGSASSFIVGIGSYADSSGGELNASADRTFNLEFRTTDDFIRVRGATNADGTYNYANGSNVVVYVNDNDTNSIGYTDPDSLAQTLAANSGAIYIDGSLVGTVGFSTSFTDEGDAGLGRIGFYSGSSVISDFTIDNITVSAIPEPSSFAAIMGVGILSMVLVRRRKA